MRLNLFGLTHHTPLCRSLSRCPPYAVSMSSSIIETIQSKIFSRLDLPPLEPGKTVYDETLVKQISALDEHPLVVSALHLANDDIHHAHLIAQDHEGDPTADLLHATLHRREGDYWNSKYWFSRMSKHPLVPSPTVAKAFVDACERAKKTDDEELRLQQWEELKRLVEWTRENCKT